MPRKPRVLLVDDDQLICDDLSALLKQQSPLELVAAVNNGAAALEVLEVSPVDVVLLDITMPVLDGISACKKIARSHPEIKIVMLTVFEHSDSLKRSLKAGAHAFLTKDLPIGRIVSIIERVVAGERVFDPAPTEMLVEAYLQKEPNADNELIFAIQQLPPRLRVVLNLLVAAKSTQEIGARMSLSERSTRTYVSQLLQATNCKHRGELIVRVMQSGYRH